MNCGWNCSKVFKLIDMYRIEPSLWNTRSPHYKDKLKTHTAWKNISIKLSTDKNEVKKKMAKLIGQYYREVRQLRETGIERKWFAFSKMDFLRDRVVDRNTTNQEITGVSMEDLGGDCEKSESNSMHYLENTTSEYEYQEQPLNIPRNTFIYQASTKDESVKKNNVQEDDEFDFFGKAVALQLRKMPLEAALNLQQELQSVVSRHRINLIKSNEKARRVKIGHESPGPSISVSSGYNNEDFLEERDSESIDLWVEEKPIIVHEDMLETEDEPNFSKETQS